MQRWPSLCARRIVAAVLGAALFHCAAVADAQFDPLQYFPNDAFRDSRITWYSAELANLQEPPLYGTEGAAGDSYRLLYLPSFQDSISVRVDVAIDGVAALRVATGSIDYPFTKPGVFNGESGRVLSAFEYSTFRQIFEGMDICHAPPDEVLGLDGYTFVFEWRSGDRYCVVERWVPDPGPFLSAGKLMLRMAGVW